MQFSDFHNNHFQLPVLLHSAQYQHIFFPYYTRIQKLLILYGLRGLAADLQSIAKLGHSDIEINRFLYKGLFAVGGDSWDKEDLLAVVMELGDMIVRARALLINN